MKVKYCPCHGNSHSRHALTRLNPKTWQCPSCMRSFDENMVPTHPPPSRRQWEDKFANLYPKLDVYTHDSLSNALELYLEHK